MLDNYAIWKKSSTEGKPVTSKGDRVRAHGGQTTKRSTSLGPSLDTSQSLITQLSSETHASILQK